MQAYNVLAPGPVNLHPEVEKILAAPMIHHRTPEFDAILKRVLHNLKSVFQTEQECFVLTSTGSGGMEALLVNVLHPGDGVLAIDSGKFGERWAEMAKVFGAKVYTLKVPWGEAVKTSTVQETLRKHPDIRVVLCQACETSTGVVHPIQEIGELLHSRPDVLFLVDGITALGAMPLPMDEWHLDGVVGGSQKAFMLPTGLSVLSFSKKAWARIETNPLPRYYFDIRREREANRKGETFFSSNVTLIRALDVVLELILKQGLTQLFREIQMRAEFTRRFGEALGFKIFPQRPSVSLTALAVPEGIDSQKLRLLLEQKHHITVMGGQDQAKGKIIRIGHMGRISEEQMTELMLKLASLLVELKPEHVFKKPLPELETEMKAYWTHARS